MSRNNKNQTNSKYSKIVGQVTSRSGAAIVSKVFNVPNHVKTSISDNIGRGTSSCSSDTPKNNRC